MLKRIALITLLAATTAITGCANSDVYSGDVYTKDRAKQVQTVSYGTILSTRPVKIQADENSLIGTIGGAVVGGLLGSTIGGGRGSDIAAAGGAIAGAAAGKAAGDKLNQVDGVELEIKKENGESIVVVQKANPTFVPGARVRMTQGNGTINVAVVN
ncbi:MULTISPECIES: glycine zipper 2TM domain-containing protein [Aeromonas]|jgi:outer membrane lipoprotein SlyB|uniref:Glycine zipper 2TM domain-containing protein n=1 Tax=Aeromonas media TaxID=651 RepID=A0A6M4Z2Q8_AERME|nr:MULTISPECIES: glycine zipper 2TM domain-containing protein [Aeromonas]MBP6070937.1 glycine zipper 2TM domain-containing protein [Aeromonas sp.]AHX59462.1 15kd peptidoglycan-associated outer membrane lipoprotein [Aeromonas media WS]MBP6166053.1 glycine zipper 2TM domain-containing protein [Aeromonas sp.]MBP8078469.1 glycine zipper 2TM domain-containing protein [Aeromonas sp.]MBP8112115.1 glycine zipper 2TM domain-containing protein [Aeromonas sp.]